MRNDDELAADDAATKPAESEMLRSARSQSGSDDIVNEMGEDGAETSGKDEQSNCDDDDDDDDDDENNDDTDEKEADDQDAVVEQ